MNLATNLSELRRWPFHVACGEKSGLVRSYTENQLIHCVSHFLSPWQILVPTRLEEELYLGSWFMLHPLFWAFLHEADDGGGWSLWWRRMLMAPWKEGEAGVCWRRQRQKLCWKGKSLFRSAFLSLVGPLPWKHSWKTNFDMCYCNWLRTSSTTPLASVMKTASSESYSGNHMSEDSVSSPWKKKGGRRLWENSHPWTPHNPGETGNSLSCLSYLP